MSTPAIAKADLLASVRRARLDWESLLAEVPRAWMSEPGVSGDWSIKDVVAHIAWGEREALGLMAGRALAGSELWRLTEDERNRAVFEQNRHRQLDDVLAEAQDVYRRYLAALAALSEEDLNDPGRFAGMPPDWRPWRVLYDPHHYPDHAGAVRRWLAGRAPREG